MIIGPKYKIARRLQAPVFEKTQTQKFSLREERKNKKRSFRKQKTDYGIQLNEKHNSRMFYCVTEKQFAKYVKQALEKKASSPTATLLKSLEHRLDNVVWRAGILSRSPWSFLSKRQKSLCAFLLRFFKRQNNYS